MLLAFLKLRLQRGELGEGRIGIRLPATLLRIDPLTRLAAIPILEIAPAFAARTIGAVRAVAVRALAAAALALLRASFGALLTILPIAPRLAIMASARFRPALGGRATTAHSTFTLTRR